MNIALAPSEIAQFLEFPLQELMRLWDQRILKRSIQVDHRTSPELAHSSVFDVMEFYVRNEVLKGDDAGSEVEAWLCAIDELVESQTWEGRSFEDMAFELMQLYLDFSGQPCEPHLMALHATQIMTAYFSLLRFIEMDRCPDQRQARAI